MLVVFTPQGTGTKKIPIRRTFTNQERGKKMVKITIDVIGTVEISTNGQASVTHLVIRGSDGRYLPILVENATPYYEPLPDVPDSLIKHLGQVVEVPTPGPTPGPVPALNPWTRPMPPAPAPAPALNPWTRPMPPTPTPAPAPAPAPRLTVEPDKYYVLDRQDGGMDFVLTVLSKRGRVYGKILRENNWSASGFRFEYEPRIVDEVQRNGRLATEQEMGKFGRRTGRCMICKRELTNPDSIERGIGPDCLKKWFG
jgi:hypothetical protein